MSNVPWCLLTVYDTASTAVSVCKPVVLDWMTWALAVAESVPTRGKEDGDKGGGWRAVHDVRQSPTSAAIQRRYLLSTCRIANVQRVHYDAGRPAALIPRLLRPIMSAVQLAQQPAHSASSA